MKIKNSMFSTFLNSLNEKQQEAVKQPTHPILVLAGPGTGKTRILIARIAWLMQEYSIPPEKILALTFTNKAAQEMQSRLMNICGQQGTDVKAGTIHSFALEILRRYHHRIGFAKNFSVCDREYQERLLKNLLTPVIRDNLDNKVKGLLLSFSQFLMKEKKLPDFAGEKFKEYESHLKKHQIIDFDQIIVNCRNLLMNNPDILAEYQFLYPAILVDEFQDTDPIQYKIIKMLALKEKNIFVVADDDQSIYSWRGANPENINNYIKDFKIDHVNFLDINYRSGEKIISSAHSLIENTDRIEPDKKLKSATEEIDDIKLFLFLNEDEEIHFITEKIKFWQNSGLAYQNMAIIYPFHKIGLSLEHYLIKENIPYQMAAGLSFLDNPLIKTIILFLRTIRDVNDDISLEQLAEIQIGLSLAKMIKYKANQKNISFRKSLYDFFRMEKGQLDFDSILKIKNFITQIASLVNLKTFYSLSRLIEEIISITQFGNQSYLTEKRKLLENIKEADEDIIGIININKSKEFFIYHPDKKISFLGSKLISKILNKRVEIRENNIQSETEHVVFALKPLADQNKNVKIIPVYEYINTKRQSSLSSLFRFLQKNIKDESGEIFKDYVVLDLETTDRFRESCGIVEIAAVKVRNGEIVDELQTLINPQKSISKGAQDVHHISEQDVKNAPTIKEYWGKFKDFIGDDIIIAHNGYSFDFAILDRFARILEGSKLPNIRLDSLTMSRALYPGLSNSIDALAERFDLDPGTRHRAQDDVKVLFELFRILQNKRKENIQNSSFEVFTDIVALSNFTENKYTATEDKIFFLSGVRKLISPYSEIIDDYCKQFNFDKSELISALKNTVVKVDSSASAYDKNENVILKIKMLAAEFDKQPIDEAISNYLSFLNLNSNGQDQLENINAVSLLTFHAAKGLEYDKVVLMGLEKNSIPGYHALREDPDDDRPIEKKIEEQRRLLYVGITRGKNEVILTAVKNRGGWENESSPFLKDLNIPKVIV